MLGIDIEDINRFKDKPQHFLERVYTQNELEYCLSKKMPEKHLAVRFCAKEAVIKALSGFGIKNVFLSDIEIFHDKNECPCVKILKDLPETLSFQLSLSHDRTKAVAVVQIEERK